MDQELQVNIQQNKVDLLRARLGLALPAQEQSLALPSQQQVEKWGKSGSEEDSGAPEYRAASTAGAPLSEEEIQSPTIAHKATPSARLMDSLAVSEKMWRQLQHTAVQNQDREDKNRVINEMTNAKYSLGQLVQKADNAKVGADAKKAKADAKLRKDTADVHHDKAVMKGEVKHEKKVLKAEVKKEKTEVKDAKNAFKAAAAKKAAKVEGKVATQVAKAKVKVAKKLLGHTAGKIEAAKQLKKVTKKVGKTDKKVKKMEKKLPAKVAKKVGKVHESVKKPPAAMKPHAPKKIHVAKHVENKETHSAIKKVSEKPTAKKVMIKHTHLAKKLRKIATEGPKPTVKKAVAAKVDVEKYAKPPMKKVSAVVKRLRAQGQKAVGRVKAEAQDDMRTLKKRIRSPGITPPLEAAVQMHQQS